MDQMDSFWEKIVIGDEISHGAFGAVYRASFYGNDCALKRILIPETPEDAETLAVRMGGREAANEYCRGIAEDLLSETGILGKFREHPNIVTVLASGMRETETGFEIFILMERLEPFSEYQLRHEMTEEDAVRLGIDVCSALEACEQEGILHRDLKPDNILVDEAGNYKICDFGVAKTLERTFTENSVRGTFAYMAPEVYHGKKYNNRADLYSLGMILYRIMNRGREPFIDAEKRQVSFKEREEALNRRMAGEALTNPADSSEELAEILMKACAWYPEKRYASASDFKEDLLRLQEGKYKKKKQKVQKFGRRTEDYYKKAALVLVPAIAAAGVLLLQVSYLYREYCVDLLDTRICETIVKDYGAALGARLNGNGVLYIESDEDLYCAKYTREYPWMHLKNRIRKIVFGENVTEIGSSGPPVQDSLEEMMYKGSLTSSAENSEYSITYDSSLIPYETDEFYHLTNLEEVEFRGKTVRIQGLGFSGCKSLHTVTCRPDADIDIAEAFFWDTPWADEKEFCMLGTTLYRYNGGESVVDRFPNSLARITANAFHDCNALREVILPEGLLVIENGAFGGCHALQHVVIPSTVNEIGYSAFGECFSLTDLEVSSENKAYVFDGHALYDAEKTTLLWCSPDVQGTFEIPDTVKYLEEQALYNGNEITTLVIPDSMSEIPDRINEWCTKLEKVVISEENPYYMVKDQMIFRRNDGALFLCFRQASGKVTVPEETPSIMNSAFSGCDKVTEIVVPDSVVTILGDAFKNCTSLRKIVLPRKLNFIGPRSFEGCTSLEDIYFGGSEVAWDYYAERNDLRVPEGVRVHIEE